MLQIRWDTAESTPVERVALAVASATVKPPSLNREKFSWRLERKPQAFADAVERSHGACPVVCHGPGSDIPTFECGTRACLLVHALRGTVDEYRSDDGGPLQLLVPTWPLPFDMVEMDECMFRILKWQMRGVSKYGRVTLVIRDPNPDVPAEIAPPEFGMFASREVKRLI